jgi:hypothetical protein
MIVRRYRELIAHGHGWSDPEPQQPVGDPGHREPRHIDAIADDELRRTLEARIRCAA